MTYYDHIARQWHKATGYEGGAFKKFVLNDVLLRMIPGIHNRSILELGAGNGYFLRLVLRRFSGQQPVSIVVTDQSKRLIEIAKEHLRIPNAEYQLLDVSRHFPFAENNFDLILASMLFNEMPSYGLKNALKECYRVLSSGGLLLIAVAHPGFVNSLRKRGELRHTRGESLTMPGSGNLRLPIVIRSQEAYRHHLTDAGFQFKEEDVFPSREVLNAKSGLKHAGPVPLALVFQCEKVPHERSSHVNP